MENFNTIMAVRFCFVALSRNTSSNLHGNDQNKNYTKILSSTYSRWDTSTTFDGEWWLIYSDNEGRCLRIVARAITVSGPARRISAQRCAPSSAYSTSGRLTASSTTSEDLRPISHWSRYEQLIFLLVRTLRRVEIVIFCRFLDYKSG